jgi:GTP-binding protein Era
VPKNKEALPTRCGAIAIVGRPNVGKSTLLNHVIGQKLCITSRKPQTTRHVILAVKTVDDVQMMFVDTPGMHIGATHMMNRRMNRAASSVLHDVDIVVWLVDRHHWTDEDQRVLELLIEVKAPVILVINKIDQIDNKDALLPLIASYSERRAFQAIVPIAAVKSQGLDQLEQAIREILPEGPFQFPADQLTDRSERFFVAEIIREKIIRQLGEELPYQTAVELEQFDDEPGIARIAALVLVEKEGQKKIVIGDQGARLKSIGQEARLDIEKMLGKKVMLKIWVKVRRGWADSERALNSLGID